MIDNTGITNMTDITDFGKDEEQFWKWFRVNHPFDWFAKEAGSPVDHEYRSLITEFARRAYTDAQQKQKNKDIEIVISMGKYQNPKKVAKAIRNS